MGELNGDCGIAGEPIPGLCAREHMLQPNAARRRSIVRGVFIGQPANLELKAKLPAGARDLNLGIALAAPDLACVLKVGCF
jgi:hypothetical protein